MAISPLPAKKVKENTARLEELFLTKNLELSPETTFYSQSVDVAIATVAKYENTATLNEIIEAAYTEDGHFWAPEGHEVAALSDIYSLWVDKAHIIAREDNLLHEVSATAHWSEHFNHDATQLILEKGSRTSFNKSFYGWEDDWKKDMGKVVAAFGLKETGWSEFTGTGYEPDYKGGFDLHVMYENGRFRDFRYETDLGSLMRELTK